MRGFQCQHSQLVKLRDLTNNANAVALWACAGCNVRFEPAPPAPSTSVLGQDSTAQVALPSGATGTDERARCAKICLDYSAKKIAEGCAGDPSEWMAHGAEACGNLILGNNEFGDAPGSQFFGATKQDDHTEDVLAMDAQGSAAPEGGEAHG